MVIQEMLVYRAGSELPRFTSHFHRFIHPHLRLSLFQFESMNERINCILTRGNIQLLYLLPKGLAYLDGMKGVSWLVMWSTQWSPLVQEWHLRNVVDEVGDDRCCS